MKPLPDFINVDRNNLHAEAEKHPRITMRWMLKLADASEAVAEADANLDLVKAQLEKRIRKRPQKYGLEGELRELAIKSAILLQPEYQEALRAYNQAKSDQRIYQAAVDSLDVKKKMIELLQWLDQRGYFSVPKKIQQQR